jgi:hypothetical protein
VEASCPSHQVSTSRSVTAQLILNSNSWRSEPRGKTTESVEQNSSRNFKKAEFTEIGRNGKPLKKNNQENTKTKVPGPQPTTLDDRRLVLKRTQNSSISTERDRPLISAINRALAASGAPDHIRIYSLSTNRNGTVAVLSAPKTPAKTFLIQRVKDIVLKVARIVGNTICDLEETTHG